MAKSEEKSVFDERVLSAVKDGAARSAVILQRLGLSDTYASRRKVGESCQRLKKAGKVICQRQNWTATDRWQVTVSIPPAAMLPLKVWLKQNGGKVVS